MRLLGIILVILGVVLLIYGGLTFFIPKDVINLGNVSITIHENVAVPLPPLLEVFFLVLGIVMIMTAPVVTKHSQATREFGSSAIKASKMASEIWSHILSGWPSLTDSEVKR